MHKELVIPHFIRVKRRNQVWMRYAKSALHSDIHFRERLIVKMKCKILAR